MVYIKTFSFFLRLLVRFQVTRNAPIGQRGMVGWSTLTKMGSSRNGFNDNESEPLMYGLVYHLMSLRIPFATNHRTKSQGWGHSNPLQPIRPLTAIICKPRGHSRIEIYPTITVHIFPRTIWNVQPWSYRCSIITKLPASATQWCMEARLEPDSCVDAINDATKQECEQEWRQITAGSNVHPWGHAAAAVAVTNIGGGPRAVAVGSDARTQSHAILSARLQSGARVTVLATRSQSVPRLVVQFRCLHGVWHPHSWCSSSNIVRLDSSVISTFISLHSAVEAAAVVMAALAATSAASVALIAPQASSGAAVSTRGVSLRVSSLQVRLWFEWVCGVPMEVCMSIVWMCVCVCGFCACRVRLSNFLIRGRFVVIVVVHT